MVLCREFGNGSRAYQIYPTTPQKPSRLLRFTIPRSRGSLQSFVSLSIIPSPRRARHQALPGYNQTALLPRQQHVYSALPPTTRLHSALTERRTASLDCAPVSGEPGSVARSRCSTVAARRSCTQSDLLPGWHGWLRPNPRGWRVRAVEVSKKKAHASLL